MYCKTITKEIFDSYISVNNNDYNTAVEAFFRNDVSFQPE